MHLLDQAKPYPSGGLDNSVRSLAVEPNEMLPMRILLIFGDALSGRAYLNSIANVGTEGVIDRLGWRSTAVADVRSNVVKRLTPPANRCLNLAAM